MNTRDIQHLFPDTWHGLLTSEQPDFNSCGTEGAERWLQEMGGSHHSDKTLYPSTPAQIQAAPDWFGLLGTLVTVDDARQNDAADSDVPSSEGSYRFFRLPIQLQRTLLNLISNHASEIPLPLLQQLTRCIQDGGRTDHWVLFHLHELQNHIATYLPKSHSQKGKVVPTCMTAGFLSEQSKGLFREVCESVSAAKDSPQEQDVINDDIVGMLSDRTPASTGFQCFMEHFRESHSADEIRAKNGDNKTKLSFLKSTPIVANEQNQAKPSFDVPVDHKQSGLNLHKRKRLKQDTGGDNSDEALVQPPPVFDDQVLDSIVEESVLLEGVESNRVNGSNDGGHVDDVMKMMEKNMNAEDGVNKDVLMDSKEIRFIKELSPENKMQLDALKSVWHSEGSKERTELCNEALRFIATCTSAQLMEVCDYLAIGDIDTSTLPVVCQSIIPLADLFSYTATGILAEKLFLDKITSLTQRAPRALNSALVDFTQSFPKPAIEGALAPCINHSRASSIQYDLVSKVAKEALGNEHRAYLLRSMLGCSDLVWSELVSGFIQNLLDMKLEMDSSLLSLLSASLGQNGTSQSKCKKFAKLLLAVINKYNKQMSPDHMVNLQRSVEVNQTFLKKACQAALKKIKI